MNTIWILVVNQAEAQIYSARQIRGSLTLENTLKNVEGTVHARDLVSDAPGRVHDRMGTSRHAMEQDTSVKEEGRRRFSKEVTEFLKAANLRGEFDQLVLLAAPGILGVIRKMLPGKLAKSVVKVIPKDVIGQGMDKIKMQLERSFELK